MKYAWLAAVAVAASGSCTDSSAVAPLDAAPDAPVRTSCASSDPFLSRTTLTMTHQGRTVFPSGLSRDELTAYYTVGNTTLPPDSDIYAATRTDRSQPFADGVLVDAIRTSYQEWGAVESGDGRELIFTRVDRPGIGIRLYHAKRAASGQPFDAGTPLLLEGLTFSGSLSADGMQLAFTYLSSYSAIRPQIREAARVADTFSASTPVLYSGCGSHPEHGGEIRTAA